MRFALIEISCRFVLHSLYTTHVSSLFFLILWYLSTVTCSFTFRQFSTLATTEFTNISFPWIFFFVRCDFFLEISWNFHWELLGFSFPYVSFHFKILFSMINELLFLSRWLLYSFNWFCSQIFCFTSQQKDERKKFFEFIYSSRLLKDQWLNDSSGERLRKPKDSHKKRVKWWENRYPNWNQVSRPGLLFRQNGDKTLKKVILFYVTQPE